MIKAGFGRTGTASLQSALGELGFCPCYHMFEVFANPGHAHFWEAARGVASPRIGTGSRKLRGDRRLAGLHVLRGAYGEAPGREGAPERARPRAVVREHPQHHLQDKQDQHRLSLLPLGFALLSRLVFGRFKTGQGPMGDEIIFRGTFDGWFEDKHHAIEVFERHNEEVRRRVPRERLLVYEVKEGWGPLCEFLGVEEPDKPFPHLNDAAEMRRMILVLRILSVAIPTALALAVGIPALAVLRRGSLRS